MKLRLGTSDDIPAIMQIVHAAVPLMRAGGNLQWDDAYPNPKVFNEDIALGQLWVAVLDEMADEGLAGVVALTTDQSPEYVHAGWDLSEPAIVVHRLVVDPALQGRGIAIALMQHAETVARQRNIARIRVDTNTKNPATQRLLPKLGYTLSGEISLDFRPGLRFFCYEKLLG
jgi:GNAT superfamily N-acetyltransferase